ncbi:MAG TPA: RNA polymerase sigma factor [Polyangia bacterium]
MQPRLAIAKDVLGGNTDGIQALYQRHATQVKRWARRLAGPTADLEDLVHDIFLVAIRKGFQSRGEASIDTWLFHITHNVILGKRRRRALRALLFGRHKESLVPPSSNTPQEEMEHRERQVRLYRALDRLPDRYRTTLVLYEIEELSGEQVAELTGTSVGTVWVRLHRGRERLVQLLGQEEPA